MKRSLRTISYREIRRSFGRFLAIMCIVMLGAGFLAGLRVTETDMLHTMDEYNAESRFFDFKVISTLGLTEDDAEYFSGLSGVEYSEGSVSTDALFTVPKSGEEVLIVHSITDSINTLKLRAGTFIDKNPVREERFETRVPDTDRIALSVGAGWNKGSFTADVSYMYLMFKERKVTDSLQDGAANTLNGKYNSAAHLPAITLGYKF